MSVAKIFKILIVIVACVIIGALVLNVLLPNTVTTLVNSVEDQIFKATGLVFDLNGDGTPGSNNTTYSGDSKQTKTNNNADIAGDVDGW